MQPQTPIDPKPRFSRSLTSVSIQTPSMMASITMLSSTNLRRTLEASPPRKAGTAYSSNLLYNMRGGRPKSPRVGAGDRGADAASHCRARLGAGRNRGQRASDARGAPHSKDDSTRVHNRCERRSASEPPKTLTGASATYGALRSVPPSREGGWSRRGETFFASRG